MGIKAARLAAGCLLSLAVITLAWAGNFHKIPRTDFPAPAFGVGTESGSIAYGRGGGNETFTRNINTYDSDPNTPRTGIGYYVSPSTGLLTSATTDVPRIEAEGYLHESGATNRVCRSSDYTQAAYWNVVQGTVTDDGTKAPDGVSIAYGLVPTTGNLAHYITGPLLSSGLTTFITPEVSTTFSFYGKSGTSDWIYVDLFCKNSAGSTLKEVYGYVDIGTGAFGAAGIQNDDSSRIESLENGWYRLVITFTSPANSYSLSHTLSCAEAYSDQIFPGDGINIHSYWWGIQAEQNPYPTSHIITSGTSIYRAGDALSFTYSSAVTEAMTEDLGSNQIVNGDMELDTRWGSQGSPTVNERSAAQVHGGSFSRKFTADGANDGIYYMPPYVSVTAGEIYKYEFWVYPDDTTSVRFFTRDGDGSQTVETITGLTQDAWNKVVRYKTMAKTGNASSVLFMENGVGTYYIDDASMKLVSRRGAITLATVWTPQGFTSGTTIPIISTDSGTTATAYFDTGSGASKFCVVDQDGNVASVNIDAAAGSSYGIAILAGAGTMQVGYTPGTISAGRFTPSAAWTWGTAQTCTMFSLSGRLYVGHEARDPMNILKINVWPVKYDTATVETRWPVMMR